MVLRVDKMDKRIQDITFDKGMRRKLVCGPTMWDCLDHVAEGGPVF